MGENMNMVDSLARQKRLQSQPQTLEPFLLPRNVKVYDNKKGILSYTGSYYLKGTPITLCDPQQKIVHIPNVGNVEKTAIPFLSFGPTRWLLLEDISPDASLLKAGE